MQPRSIASYRALTARATTAPVSFFDLPWQPALLAVVLTLGATVHRFPHTFQPLLSYAHGMAQAAHDWRTAPPADSCAYAGL